MFGSAWISNPCHRGIILSKSKQFAAPFVSAESSYLHQQDILSPQPLIQVAHLPLSVQGNERHKCWIWCLICFVGLSASLFLWLWSGMFLHDKLRLLMQFWIKSYIYPTSIYSYQLIFFFATINSFWCLSLRLQLGYFLCSEVSSFG